MSDRHYRDGIGICMKCDRCDDADCCEQVPCDGRSWDMEAAWDKVQTAMAHAGRGARSPRL